MRERIPERERENERERERERENACTGDRVSGECEG